MTATSIAPIVVSFLCVVLCLIPFPWHWRSRNIPTIMLIVWIGQGNFFRGISAILWRGNVIRKALVYCDIVLELELASVWGMTACAFCITRHLESVASPRYSTSGLSDPRKRKMFEIFMCVISPWLFAAIHLIVQGHRFDLIENIGCSVTTYWSWASIWLFYVPPIVLSLATSVYAGLALRWFIQRRAVFHDLLNNSGLTTSRYMRLMGLALAELCGTLGCNAYILASNANYPLRPWISWNNVHSDFKRVAQFPMAIMSQDNINSIWGTWSLYPISAVCFFAFFAFGQEAIAEYKKSWEWIRVNIFRRAATPRHVPGNVSLPSFVASNSMASRSKGQLASSRSMNASAKWDPSLTLDLDSDSLYDADEHRGRRSVALNDLESGSPTESFDEKSYAPSLTPSSTAPPAPTSIPPLPTLPQAPAAVHHVPLTRSSSMEEGTPGTPRAF